MAHLFSGNISTNNSWEKLSELAEVTFVKDKTYKIQILSTAYLREGSIGEGFKYTDTEPFEHVSSGDEMYIKTPVSSIDCFLSIADVGTPQPEPSTEPSVEPSVEPSIEPSAEPSEAPTETETQTETETETETPTET